MIKIGTKWNKLEVALVSAKRRSKVKKWIPLGIIAIIVVGVAASFLTRPASISYESVVAKIGDITTYNSFSGNVETKNRQTVTSEKVMQVSEIKVKEGDLVNEGAVLIKTTAGDEIKSKISGEIVKTVEVKSGVLSGETILYTKATATQGMGFPRGRANSDGVSGGNNNGRNP